MNIKAIIILGLTLLAMPAITLYIIAPKNIGTDVYLDQHSTTFTKPVFMVEKLSIFEHVYRACPSSESEFHYYLHYLGTLRNEKLALAVSLFRDLNSLKALLVYHVGEEVLDCVSTSIELVKSERSALQPVAKNVTAYYSYEEYMLRIPSPPLSLVDTKPSLAEEVAIITEAMTIIEFHVEGVIVYDYGFLGDYIVHLKGVVWIKEESNGSREIVDAIERGSYTEMEGALKYLFSQCWFNARAEYNRFAAFIKGSWGIAENACPLTMRCRGRPAVTVYPDRRITIDPGGGTCNLELGCGCYGWSPSDLSPT